MTTEPDNQLWAFALQFYGRSKVPEACLTLQTDMGADVIALIVVVYAWAAQGRALTGTELGALQEATAAWRADAVLPLRHIRQYLKPPREDVPNEIKEHLRDQVKRAELSAERIQIAIAHAWLTGTTPLPGETDLEAALDRFVARCDQPPTSRCGQALSLLRQTACEMREAAAQNGT